MGGKGREHRDTAHQCARGDACQQASLSHRVSPPHCLVPADAFYEWQPGAGRKQPYRIRLRDEGRFGMAGLWERWKSPDGHAVESCTIVTVEANSLIAELHDRMPLIRAPGDYDAWLKAETGEAALTHAVAADDMVAYPVSPLVGNAKNDVPVCLVPIDAH